MVSVLHHLFHVHRVYDPWCPCSAMSMFHCVYVHSTVSVSHFVYAVPPYVSRCLLYPVHVLRYLPCPCFTVFTFHRLYVPRSKFHCLYTPLSVFRCLFPTLSSFNYVNIAVCLSFTYRLVGLVVKASASRAEDPEFDSRLRRDFFRDRVKPVT